MFVCARCIVVCLSPLPLPPSPPPSHRHRHRYRAPSQSKRRCYNRNRSWPGFSVFSVRSGPFFMNYIPVLSFCFWSVLFLFVCLLFHFFRLIFSFLCVCSLVALNSTKSRCMCVHHNSWNSAIHSGRSHFSDSNRVVGVVHRKQITNKWNSRQRRPLFEIFYSMLNSLLLLYYSAFICG